MPVNRRPLGLARLARPASVLTLPSAISSLGTVSYGGGGEGANAIFIFPASIAATGTWKMSPAVTGRAGKSCKEQGYRLEGISLMIWVTSNMIIWASTGNRW